VVSDELQNRMIKPHIPKVGEWKENTPRRSDRRLKRTSSMLMDKYVRQQQERLRAQQHGDRRGRSPYYGQGHRVRHGLQGMTQQATMKVQARQETRAGDPRPLCEHAGWSGQENRLDDSVVMIISIPCRLKSEVHVDGQRVVRAGLAQRGL
jgi:hypothetical protein